MPPTPRFCVLLLVFAELGLAAPAFADDASNRAAARDLGDEGLAAFEAGHFDEAATKLARAYAIVKLPTLGLYTARAYVELGKWVEASELYLETTRLDASGGVQATQEQAKRDAAREREALLPRIPRLTVELHGATPANARVTIDGVELPGAVIGVARPINPGSHTIEAVSGGRRVTKTVDVREATKEAIVLDVAEVAPAPAPPAAPPPQPPATPAPEPSGGSFQPIAGWTAIGIGGAGLVFGAVTGSLALSKKSALDDEGCKDGSCYEDQKGDVDSYNSMLTLSTVGFAVGAAGVGTGVVLLLLAPKDSNTKAGIQPVIGFDRIGVRGRF